MAHSAYPELGDSAIHKLIDALADIRRIPLPVDDLLGPSTLNVGTLSGGRAPNVIADEARADVMIRLVGDSAGTKSALERAVEGRAELREVIEIPAVRLDALDGIDTTVVAFTTDIPAFDGKWGQPFLIGPGTIHVAHTLEERVPKQAIDRSCGTLSTDRQTIMQTRIEVGILGATGMVGQNFIGFLQGHPWFDLKWLGASDRSAGKKYKDAMNWNLAGSTPDSVASLMVEECKPGNAPRLLFSAMDASIATGIERAFAEAGHVVVSNSRNHRMERDVPLLVPEINPDHLKLVPGQQQARGWKGKIVTNPNCSTIVLTMGLGAVEAVRHRARSSPPPCRPFPARDIPACRPWTSWAT